jgi:hypothetical protein
MSENVDIKVIITSQITQAEKKIKDLQKKIVEISNYLNVNHRNN